MIYLKDKNKKKKRDIFADEKEQILKDFNPQKIFFDELGDINDVIKFLDDIENLLKKIWNILRN